jgi:hypothetical protein
MVRLVVHRVATTSCTWTWVLILFSLECGIRINVVMSRRRWHIIIWRLAVNLANVWHARLISSCPCTSVF